MISLINLEIFLVALLPCLVHAYDPKSDHLNDVYFEVIEPTEISYTFRCRSANDIGASFDRLLKNIYLVPSKPLGACSRLENQRQLRGNIVLAERGGCSFVTKILFAEEAGAVGVIIMDNDRTADDRFVDMIDDYSKRTVHIPGVFLQHRDGHLILDSLEKNQLIGARINIPLNLTYEQMLQAHRAPGSYWL